MKRAVGLLIGLAMIISLVACGNDAGETVSKSEYDTIVLKLNEAEEKQVQMQTELESIKNELEALKIAIQEEEKQEIEAQTETVMEEKEEEGLTIATEPITVPDPETQSKFVVEVTTENFLSIFEFIDINRYDTWGEFLLKRCCFSSLLYEQGWALGEVEDFSVEYSVFGTSETIAKPDKQPAFYVEENTEPNFCLLRAKGTLTFYRVKDVRDEIVLNVENSRGRIIRTLPNGTQEEFQIDIDGILVY